MKNLFLLIAVVVVLAACSVRDGGDELQVIPVVEHLKKVEEVPVEEFGKSVKYVQLETTDSILVGNISKIFMADDKLFILDYNSCMVFDLDGKYLFNVGRKGEGPEEYMSITSFYFNDNLIHLYDVDRQHVQRFDMEGNLVDEINTPLRYDDLFPLSEDISLGFMGQRTGDQITMGYIWDGVSHLDSIPNLEQFTPGGIITVIYNEGVVYNLDNRNYYKNVMYDTVYQITENYNLRPKYFFDHGKHRMVAASRYQMRDPAAILFENMSWVAIVGETENFLFFKNRLNRVEETFYWDKRDKTLHNVRFTYPGNIPDKYFFNPGSVSEDKKYLISSLNLEENEENPVIVLVELP